MRSSASTRRPRPPSGRPAGGGIECRHTRCPRGRRTMDELCRVNLFGASGPTCRRCLIEWHETGVWRRLHERLLAGRRVARLPDLSAALVYSSHLGALEGEHTGRSPVDRRQPTSKHQPTTDAHGTPLAVTLTGGHRAFELAARVLPAHAARRGGPSPGRGRLRDGHLHSSPVRARLARRARSTSRRSARSRRKNAPSSLMDTTRISWTDGYRRVCARRHAVTW